MRRGGGEDNITATSSFVANAHKMHTGTICLLYGKRKKIGVNRGSGGRPLCPLNPALDDNDDDG